MPDLQSTSTIGKSDVCEHADLDLSATGKRAGGGVIATVTLVCKSCGLRWVSPAGKSGKYVEAPATVFVPQPSNGQTAKPAQQVTQNPEKKAPTFQEKIDKLGPGPGTEGLRMFHEMGMIDCSGCWNLAARMNKEGVAWCLSERGMTFIVEDALPRAVAFWNKPDGTVKEKLSAWAKSPISMWDSAKFLAMVAGGDLENALRMLLQRLFTEAIRRAGKAGLIEALTDTEGEFHKKVKAEFAQQRGEQSNEANA